MKKNNLWFITLVIAIFFAMNFWKGIAAYCEPIGGNPEEEQRKLMLEQKVEYYKKKADYDYVHYMKPKKEKKISNILLVGVDSLDSRRNGRSDCMMILTVDKSKDKLKLTSLMRDTYVYIEGHGKEKLNHSFAYGGIDLLRKTVQDTFKIEIDNYAIVDFHDFEEIVDLIGGTDVYIDDKEVEYLNTHYEEMFKEKGLYRISGQVTLTYARMRKVGGCSARTKRHREVLESLKENIKELSILKYPKLVSTGLKSVKTDMGLGTILDHGYWLSKNIDGKMETMQIPSDKYSKGELIPDKGWVLKMDHSKNVKLLNEFIFGMD